MSSSNLENKIQDLYDEVSNIDKIETKEGDFFVITEDLPEEETPVVEPAILQSSKDEGNKKTKLIMLFIAGSALYWLLF